ncbi:hypothetical protein M409DRAFT_57786 [Zasmidium cellare ATCC 36951]|uniref:Altered inheritance of mitochondria protein 11 n=1 Tax=Zasmidium cellare ATCC 36951 TaxID=1080233 RepID=A0A6A6C7F4_ZASCE|nr:uncharacterized protein M409DRAFT_57786 [Zasmidium cellare ATCC 36951]KAF2163117.1 hypothetical protein M409DRAFT_57786 [Zasmidium cellare ATCC 36951]
MSSWWDRYFAPGDVRAARRQEEQQIHKELEDLEKRPAPIIPNRIDAAHRARRQNALLFGGLAFTFLSAFITRRSLTRKQHITALYPHLSKTTKGSPVPKLEVPHFTTSNNQAKAEGGLDAVEALFLATINVGAIFMAGTGAVMKFFDIADIEDVRELVKKGTGQDLYGGDAEADKEMEEWVAGVLAKKDEKGTWDFQSTIAEKLKELDDIEKRKAQKVVEQDVEKR